MWQETPKQETHSARERERDRETERQTERLKFIDKHIKKTLSDFTEEYKKF
jgi:hypothetical protein